MRNIISAILALGMISATSAVALAGSAKSNKAAAQNMVNTIKSNEPGFASIASTVSGNKNPVAPSFSGWGNVGSAVVAGDQVSRGK